MRKKIATVALSLASDDVEYCEFDARSSLSDWDIILFRPDLPEDYLSAEYYQGKPSLLEASSFQLKASCEHWRREIRGAVAAGKTVIVFLAPLEEVWVDTGQRRYSGTGRNRHTTRVVQPYSNYACLPVEVELVVSIGTAMKLAPRFSNELAAYWAGFADVSSYQVVLSGSEVPACVLTRDSAHVVGALCASKDSAGTLLLLPDVDFYADGFIRDHDSAELGGSDEEEGEWTAAAAAFAGRMVAACIALDKSLRTANQATPEPSWAAAEVYALADERRLQVELLEGERQLSEVQRALERIQEAVHSAGRPRALLYEKGKPLERAVREALELLGFNATGYREGLSEFDVVFECAEGRLIGEVEGKDTKAVSVEKLRQLSMNIHEDLQRDDVSEPAKAVLFGNAFRLQEPSERDAFFTQKCVAAALSSSTALADTVGLFHAVRYLAGRPDPEFARECRRLLLSSVGLVRWPAPPEPETESLGEA